MKDAVQQHKSKQAPRDELLMPGTCDTKTSIKTGNGTRGQECGVPARLAAYLSLYPGSCLCSQLVLQQMHLGHSHLGLLLLLLQLLPQQLKLVMSAQWECTGGVGAAGWCVWGEIAQWRRRRGGDGTRCLQPWKERCIWDEITTCLVRQLPLFKGHLCIKVSPLPSA